MLYLNRRNVAEPKVFRTLGQELLEESEAFYNGPDALEASESFQINPKLFEQQSVRLALTKLFHNKCAYCESVLTYNPVVHESKIKRKKRREKADLNNYQLEENLERIIRHFSPDDYRLEQLDEKFIYEWEQFKWSMDLFRPCSRALNQDGGVDFGHYWWLTYSWNNLYLACEHCSHHQGQRFPVSGKRSQRGEETREENALLIDPCLKNDFDEQHFLFNGAEAVPLTEKGRVTIETFALNRPVLKKKRQERLDQVLSRFDSYMEADNAGKAELKEKLVSDFKPYQPYQKAVYDNIDNKYGFKGTSALEACFDGNPPDNLFSEFGLQTKSIFIVDLDEKQKEYEREKIYSLDEEDNIDKTLKSYFGTAKWISKVEIKNFKIIKELTLEFPNISGTEGPIGQNRKKPWLTLLGENGVGKSSILQAMALTLMGEKRANSHNLDPRRFVNRNSNEDSGWVKVYLTDREEPLELQFNKNDKLFTVTPKDPQVILMGYGATRLLTKDDEELKKDYIRTRNLFDPFARLDNVQTWLSDKEKVGDELFESITRSMKDLLMLEPGQKIYRDFNSKGETEVFLQLKEKGQGQPLDFLSDGYKSVIALALDIMVGINNLMGKTDKIISIKDAQGLVLIDEIGVHLHPRWKMQIVSSLRRTFPQMNFIITTHEPLCLRGLDKGEVILARRDESQEVEIISDLPSPRDFRIDQLLTSTFFGLSTVLDPEIELKYDNYYNLVATIGDNPTAEEKEQIRTLEKELKNHKTILGSTMREELELKLIEKRIAHFKDKDGELTDVQMVQDLAEKLKPIWDGESTPEE